MTGRTTRGMRVSADAAGRVTAGPAGRWDESVSSPEVPFLALHWQPGKDGSVSENETSFDLKVSLLNVFDACLQYLHL